MYSKSAKALIIVMLVNAIVDIFIKTFFTAHMLLISGNDIAFISKFYIMVYIVLGITYFALVPLVKKFNNVNLLRIGCFTKGIFILLVVLLGDGIMQNYLWLGALYGIVEATYWSGGNSLKNLVVESNRIKGYLSIISVNSSVVGILIPIIFGVSIDMASFEKIAIIVLILITVQVVSSFFISVASQKASSTEYKSFVTSLKQDKLNSRNIQGTYILLFLTGLQYFIPVFLVYMIVYVLKTNTTLGILTSISSLIAIFVLVLINVIKKADTNIWLYIAFSVLEAVSLILAIIFMQPVFVIIFQLVYTMIRTTVDTLSESLRGITIRNAGLDRYLPESLAIGELFLNSGRAVGFLSLLVLGLVNSTLAVIILGVIYALFLFAYNIATGVLKKRVKEAELKSLSVNE